MSDEVLLKDFISQTLDDICTAIFDLRKHHPQIAPIIDFENIDDRFRAQEVEFDIAVTVTNSESTSKGGNKAIEGGAKLAVIKGSTNISNSADTKKTNNSENTTRIKFSVPIYMQYQPEVNKKTKENKMSKKPKYAPVGDINWMG